VALDRELLTPGEANVARIGSEDCVATKPGPDGRRVMKKPQQPRVSVVIPHSGADGPLEGCILALRKQTYRRDSVEIIVVLNEASQRPLEFRLDPGEVLLWEPHFYSYAARNAGIQKASGAIIALTDSDTIPQPDWLEQGVAAIGASDGLIAGAIDLTFTRRPLTPSACYEQLFAFDQEKNVSLGRATAANLFARKELLESLGAFSDTAASGEDFRWTSAAVKSGTALRYAPSARVNHPARESMRELLLKAQRVTEHFPRSETPWETITRAVAQYRSLYAVPPSAEKRASCTPRERTTAHVVALVVQLSKAWFFLKTLFSSNQTPQ
jgi:cellulose synthase/poly-beta-1,6-N-acetylglucosamine synthase-like glycosyltransferase